MTIKFVGGPLDGLTFEETDTDLVLSTPSTEFTPVLTGYTGNGWTVSVSEAEYVESGVTGYAWKALDGSAASALWQNGYSSARKPTSTSPITWSLRSTTPFSLSKLGIRVRTDLACAPVSFKVVNTEGVVLYDTASLPWTTNESTFDLTPSTTSGIDLILRDSNGSLVQIDQIRLWS